MTHTSLNRPEAFNVDQTEGDRGSARPESRSRPNWLSLCRPAPAGTIRSGTLTSLTAQWDTARFQQWARQNAAAYASLTATSLRLGSRPCAAYFGS